MFEVMSTKCQGTFPDTGIDHLCCEIVTILLGVPCAWAKEHFPKEFLGMSLGGASVAHS